LSGGGFGVAWGNVAGIYVAVGRTSGGAAIAAASPDGIIWTALSTTFGGGLRATGIAYSPYANTWVVSVQCSCSDVYYSDDAYSTWTADSTMGSSFWTNNVCYGAPTSQFVAGSSQDPTVAANTYASVAAGTLIPGGTVNLIERSSCNQFEMYGCAWGNNQFLFFGEGAANHHIATSPLAVSCTGVVGGDAIFTTRARHGAYGVSDTRWVAVGEGTNGIAYSNDNGATWTGIGTSIFTNGYYVAVRE
jgi:hypothetical protein